MFLNLRLAVSSLSAHKLRAILAMIGVLLGALAFTGVQAISQSMVLDAQEEAEKLGPNLMAVVAGQVRFTRSGNVRSQGTVRNFSVSDARALMAGVPSVVAGTPFVSTTMDIRSLGTTVTCRLMAVWPQYVSVRNFRPEMGRFFTASELEDRAKVVVLGRKIAERLFRSPEDALGKQVFFYRASFRVVGVMETKGRDLSGEDQDEQVFIPLSTYMRRAANQDWINGVFLNLAPGGGRDAAKLAATDIMRKRHRITGKEEDDFSVLTAADAVKLQQQALDLVQTLGLITSSVSFAVGGLGILSIMILIVRARRVEIGIRRAVGGRRSDIVRQFLFEAGLMSGSGGALGVLAAGGLAAAVCHFADMPLSIDPVLFGGTLLGSVLLGLAAGSYPAWQAAKIEILDVLKS